MNNKSRGSALLSALFIMTLVAIAATAMSVRLQFDIYRTQLLLSSDQLYLASQAVNFWAMDALEKTDKPFINKDGKLAVFPLSLQKLSPGIVTTGELYDLQAVFNINNLEDKKYHPVFIKLLEQILTNKNRSQYLVILKAIYNWISPYQADHTQDDYLTYYQKQQPPYIPSYQLMANASELRLVRDISYKNYQEITPFVTALPEVTPININTASKDLLMSLGNGLNSTQVNALIQARGKAGIKNLNELKPLFQKLNLPLDQMTVESVYYLSVATTKIPAQDLELKVYTVLKRVKNKKGVFIGIISQNFNTI